ncbi:MAG: hypothetical protein WC564_03490 [Patescibacteria group bacterium]
MIYQEKLIISGNQVELYKYEGLVKSRAKWKKPKEVKRRTKEQVIKQMEQSEESNFAMEVMRHSSLRRTRSRITRLINSNQDMQTFITLTFRDNITDLFEANVIFKKFIQRLKRQFPKLKYLAVPEFQKRGAVHYHILVNIDYLENNKLSQIWDQGFVMINKIKHINNLGMYISKYICKDLFDVRYFGMRKVLCSRNLEQPMIITAFKEIIKFFNPAKLKLLFERNYISDWLGEINYSLFSLSS